MKKVFAMGACRIQQGIQQLGYEIHNCWYYTHTLSQAIQACKYFKGELNYPDGIYDLVKIQGRPNYPAHAKFEILSSSFKEAEIIFLEIQTDKNYEYQGFFLNQECNEAKDIKGVKTYRDSKEELKNKMAIVEQIFPCRVVFVPHVFSKKWLDSMSWMTSRKLIEESVIEFCTEKNNRLMFIPSDFVDQYGDQMMLKTKSGDVDINHYSNFGANIIAEQFLKIINS